MLKSTMYTYNQEVDNTGHTLTAKEYYKKQDAHV